MSGKFRFTIHRFLFLSIIVSSFGIIFSQKTPTYASTAPFDITGTIDTSDLVFDTDKILLNCTSVWANGSNYHYEARQITVDQDATLTLRDINNTPPASPTTTNDVSYGVFDVTSTPFDASNLPLTGQCIGAATNSLNVAMQAGKIYWLVIRHFNNANGAPNYDLQVTSTNSVVNVVVGAPGGAPPPVPKITNITSSAVNGNYGPGATISIDVIFDYPVEYTSIGAYMVLTLNNGSTATCTYCNAYPTAASTTYTFTYDVSGSDVVDLDAISTSALDLFGGTLKGTDGTTASITTPAPGAAGSLGANKDINVVTPQLSATNPSIVEGNAGSVTMTFTIALSAAMVQPTIMVDYATVNGTATTADNDYVATSGTLTFAPGQTSKTVNVTVNGDTKNEANETFTLNLFNPDYASIGNDGLGTITNDDPVPSLSIGDRVIAEGNSGTTTASFTVSLSAVSGQTVTVSYATTDGTAATADGDYVAASGALSFAPGQTSKTINVTVNGDTKYEANEDFQVDLSGAANATIADSQGIGTLTNDDTSPGITISPVTVTEGNSGTSNADFTVTLSAASGLTATVFYTTADITATTADSDYVATSGTLTFAPGETSKTITVLVNGDTKDEINETFNVGIGAPTNAYIVVGVANGTITNDDTSPSLSIGNATVNEGDSGTANAAFTVTLSAASGKTVTVNYGTADGTATTANSDYTATSGTVTFTPGQTSKTINVLANGDTVFEPDETYTLTLSAPVNATITTATGTGTITNDDPQALLSISNVTVNEGNFGTTSATFTVTMSPAILPTVTVNYATSNGTATTANGDYVATSGTLTFAPGDISKTITVLVNGDTTFETDETFAVTLSGPTNASITTATGTGTITNDDTAPTLSIGNATVTEGDSGTVNTTFTVALSSASGVTTTVDYATSNGTATTADGDYTATSGTLTFTPGQTSQTINVTVNGDTKDEANETFTATLNNPTNATITTASGTGTINNDDTAPSLSIGNATVTEIDSGTTNALFNVSLAAVSGKTVTVNYATSDGTATIADNDYVATSGTLTFTPGQTSQTITIPVNGDTKNEANETFTVTLSAPTNATLLAPNATGTINNDDAVPGLSIGNATVTEGDSGTTTAAFTVTLSAVSGQTVTVNYATVNGTATTADGDYTATSGTLTFTPGQTSQTINAAVNGDTKNEADETFTVTLSAASNATITTASGTGTINNDDAVPGLSIGNATVTEGNAGTVNAAFTVTLAAVSGQTVTVDYVTADGTATTADNDYTATSGTLTFTPGQTSQTINVTVNGDTKDEANETFTATLSNSTNATITTASGTGTINNDDTAPSLSIGNATVTEGNSGTTSAAFTVTLSAVSGKTVTVDYTTVDGTATTADSDYTATSGTLVFTPGQTSQTINAAVNGDTKDEADETFTVTLSNPSSATIATANGTGTITNDDSAPSLSIDNVTVSEGDSGTTALTFTVTLSAVSGKTITVNYASADITALAGSDYTAASGTLTFAPGETTKTITVLATGETFFEQDETFTVTLSAPSNATITTAVGTGTITNDDGQPSFSIGDVTLAEGNSGTTAFTFTVTRSGDPSLNDTVDFATNDGSANAGSDYVSTSGTLTFATGVTTQTITVTVNGDISLESDETFTVDLSNASAPATITDNQAVGTITNDDVPAGLAVGDITLAEGSSGATVFNFIVTRGGDTTVSTTVDFTTADNSATTADNDYVATSGTLTFAVGETSQTISVSVNGDVYLESDETFSVLLSNASAPAAISDKEAVGTITNDDLPPGISVSDVSVAENGGGSQFTVTLSPAVNGMVTVDYVITDGTAVNGIHYGVTAASGTLSFATGITTQTIPFTVVDNTIADGSHSFNIQLSNSSGPAITQATAKATIVDNEIKVVQVQAPPPATQCTDTNFENPGMIRTHFTNDADRAGLGCRLIAANGNYMSWLGSPLTSNANVGDQSVLNLGVVAAVDVFSSNGVTGFVGDVNVCLKGSGYIIYMNANNAPRVPQLWSAWTTPSFPGYTCTTLYAPGTVILVQQKPS